MKKPELRGVWTERPYERWESPDNPEVFEDCDSTSELVSRLQMENGTYECNKIKTLKQASSGCATIGSLSWVQVADAVCTLLESDITLHLQLEATEALLNIIEHYEIGYSLLWRVERLLAATDSPALKAELISVAVALVRLDQGPDARSVVNELRVVLEAAVDAPYDESMDWEAAASGLKELAEHNHGVVIVAEPAKMAEAGVQPRSDLVAAAFAASDAVGEKGPTRQEQHLAQQERQRARELLTTLNDDDQAAVIDYLTRVAAC